AGASSCPPGSWPPTASTPSSPAPSGWTTCWPPWHHSAPHGDDQPGVQHRAGRGSDARRRPRMSPPILVETLRALVDRRDLTRTEAAAAMEAIMSGAATPAQIGAVLTALRMKGETVEELIGFAQVMRQKAVRVRTRGEA